MVTSRSALRRMGGRHGPQPMGCNGTRRRIRASSGSPERSLASSRSMVSSSHSPRPVACGRHRSPSIADLRSANGGRWPPWTRDGCYGSAALARPGAPLTVIASTNGDRLGLWTSLDGTTWNRIGRLPDVLATTAIQLPTGWLAVGGLDISTGCATIGPTIGLTWTSPDGRTWTRLRDDPRGVISALAMRGDTLVGLGEQTVKNRPRRGAVWTMHVDAPPSAVPGTPTRVPVNRGCGG